MMLSWTALLERVKQKVIMIVSQPERIGHLLTDTLRKFKGTLRQFLTGLPRFFV